MTNISFINSSATNIPLADKSVQCVVFSPPYLGARWYKSGVYELGQEQSMDCLGWVTGNECDKCFLCGVLKYSREIYRVLRDDGTMWFNIGDCLHKSSYGTGGTGVKSKKQNTNKGANFGNNKIKSAKGVKIKDWCLIPERIVLALQLDGWYVRSKITWKKLNPMPFPVTDRPAASTEMIYLFTKSDRYFYDHIAVREPAKESSKKRIQQKSFDKQSGGEKDYAKTGGNPSFSHRKILENFKKKSDKQSEFGNPTYNGFNERWKNSEQGLMRELRDVWEMSTAQYKGSHYAVYPMKIPEIAIKAGTSEFGCCSKCKSPYYRDTKQHGKWHQFCDCKKSGVIPCTVLDIFVGSGTTTLVAKQLGRNAIGCDLNFEYLNTHCKNRLIDNK